mmetsp:Transcript_96612/g.251854  ORF Transcript_96612/g.251854 Transcript_96612/m.251854 type:complete len:234 (+) Transcript_96612:154-855(+)
MTSWSPGRATAATAYAADSRTCQSGCCSRISASPTATSSPGSARTLTAPTAASRMCQSARVSSASTSLIRASSCGSATFCSASTAAAGTAGSLSSRHLTRALMTSRSPLSTRVPSALTPWHLTKGSGSVRVFLTCAMVPRLAFRPTLTMPDSASARTPGSGEDRSATKGSRLPVIRTGTTPEAGSRYPARALPSPRVASPTSSFWKAGSTPQIRCSSALSCPAVHARSTWISR